MKLRYSLDNLTLSADNRAAEATRLAALYAPRLDDHAADARSAAVAAHAAAALGDAFTARAFVALADAELQEIRSVIRAHTRGRK